MFPVIGAFEIGRTDVFELITRAWFQGALAAATLILVLGLRKPSTFAMPFKLVAHGANSLRISVAAIGNILSHACLFGSFYFMNKAAATTIFETWPLIVAYVMPMLFKGKFKSFGAAEIIYGLVGFCGLALLTLDSTIAVAPAGAESIADIKPQVVGLILAGSASLFQALGTSVYATVVERSPMANSPIASVVSIQMLYCLVGSIAGAGVMALVSDFNLADLFIIDFATFYGIGILLIGNVAFFLAVHYARRSTIVLMWYFTPLISLVAMLLLGLSTFTTAIIVGAALIIISNILSNFPGDRTLSYAATMVAIGVSAALNFPAARLAQETDFEIIAVPAGVFAILVAFMMERVSQKKAAQEIEALDILSQLSRLHAQGAAKAAEIAAMFMVALPINDSSRLQRIISTLQDKAVDSTPEVRLSVTRYALYRMNSLAFGEVMILWMVGLATIIITQLSVPDTFAGDLLAIALTAAIAFMCFGVLDQTNLSGDSVLWRYYRDNFPVEHVGQEAPEGANRVLTVALTIALFGLYIAGLLIKYQDELFPNTPPAI